jgi:hypothetical protein
MDNLYQILDEAQTVVSNCDDYTFQMGSGDMSGGMSGGMSDYVQPLEATSSQVKPIARKSKGGSKKRSWKKPKDKPKRPLSAYNLFFQHERNNILAALPGDDAAMDDGLTEEQRRRKHRKTHGKIGFADLARSIADKWKNIEPTARSVFEARADIEKQRYKKELEAWKLTQTGIDAKTSSKRKSPKSRASRASKPMLKSAAQHPEALTSLMSSNMNSPRSQMMQVLSNPLFNQHQLPQQHQQFQQQQMQQQQEQQMQQQHQAPRRNSNLHEQLMAQCAQNLMRSTNSALPLSCLSQINSLQQSVADGISPLAALQQQQHQELQMVNMVPPQQQHQAVPDETFSRETFFEDNTDDDATYSGDDYSGDSYSGDSYDSSDDDMDTRSTDSTLEDDLNDFLSGFDTNEILYT